MPILPVVLWTDLLLFLLIGVAVAATLYVRREPHLLAGWRRVGGSPAGMAAASILACFLVVGLLDSLHYRAALDGGRSAKPSSDLKQAKPGNGASDGGIRYAVEVSSLFDLVAHDLRTHSEKTYSAPFATVLFAKEAVERPDGTQVREFPRLKFGGVHLTDPDQGFFADVGQRTLRGVALAVVIWLVLGVFISASVAHRSSAVLGTTWYAIWRGETDLAWRAALITVGLLLLVLCPLFVLADAYHVFGTDKVGQDVLFLTLKSIRTALIIGTLTTLVMLPLAVALGIFAGYFGGWVDDLIQYLYTTLNSIPSVLLIAASVLMMQVVIDTHPEWFATSAERADARLLALCLILGVTSWTGLCRLLRGETLKLRELDYVLAARAFGVSQARIMARHILPNLMHIVLMLGRHGFQRPGAGGGGAVVRRCRRRSVDHQLRHHDQYRAHGAGARTDGLVVAARRLRVHVPAGPVGQPVCRCRARCLRSENAKPRPAAPFARAGGGMNAPLPILLAVDSLSAYLAGSQGEVRAVDCVSLMIERGRTFALLGESGCGKSMTALAIMRLLPDGGAIVGGEVRLEGDELTRMTESEMRDVRGGRLAMIFQEPATSLNPVLTVGRQIGEALAQHRGLRGQQARTLRGPIAHRSRHCRCVAPARRVSVPALRRHEAAGDDRRWRWPVSPKLLIADEPTTALDVTIQAQMLELLRAPAERARHGHVADHARSRRGRAHGAPGRRHVRRRPDRRGRPRKRSLPRRCILIRASCSPPCRRQRCAAGVWKRSPAACRGWTGRPWLPLCRSLPAAWDRCRDASPRCGTQRPAGQAVRCHLFDRRSCAAGPRSVQRRSGVNPTPTAANAYAAACRAH